MLQLPAHSLGLCPLIVEYMQHWYPTCKGHRTDTAQKTRALDDVHPDSSHFHSSNTLHCGKSTLSWALVYCATDVKQITNASQTFSQKTDRLKELNFLLRLTKAPAQI